MNVRWRWPARKLGHLDDLAAARSLHLPTSMLVRWYSILAVTVLGCSHDARSTTPADKVEPAQEHWETVSDRRFVYPGPCATGPFEVTFPAREIEYGRRTVLIVYGRRGVELDNRIDGAVQWGIAMTRVHEGDHSRCRSDQGGEPVAISAAAVIPPKTPVKGGGRGGRNVTPPPPVETRKSRMDGVNTPASELPKLVEYSGELPNVKQQFGAVGWFPKGDPFYYADEYWTAGSDSNLGAKEFRVRFWFSRPSDVSGLVFRFLDERMVPDLPRAVYDGKLAARVSETKAKQKALQPQIVADFEKANKLCEQFPDDAVCIERRRVRGRIPPAPLAETRPRAPSNTVDWVPGYWSFNTDADEFVWIGGTFIVRPPKVVVAAVPPSTPTPALPPVVMPPPAEPSASVPIEPPRTITATIDPIPPPRVELISAPPQLPGAIWIVGHWRLVGSRWEWIAGTWMAPPGAGDRYQTPSINVRGTVRVYLPGRWIRVR